MMKKKINLKFNKFQYSLIVLMLLGIVGYLISFYLCNKMPTNGKLKDQISYFLPIISVIAAFSNVFCILLLANKSVYNFVFGSVAVILFSVVGAITQNWLFIFLNLCYYLPMNIYGFISWKKSMKKSVNNAEPLIRTMKKRNFIGLLLISILIGVGISFIFIIPGVRSILQDKEDMRQIGYWLKLIFNGISLILCVVAMLLVIYVYRQQWYFWIFANIAMLLLWLFNILYYIEKKDITNIFSSSFTLFTYSFSFVNSVYAVVTWKNKK